MLEGSLTQVNFPSWQRKVFQMATINGGFKILIGPLSSSFEDWGADPKYRNMSTVKAVNETELRTSLPDRTVYLLALDKLSH